MPSGLLIDVALLLAKPHKPVSLFTLLSFVPFHCQDVSLRNLAGHSVTDFPLLWDKAAK